MELPFSAEPMFIIRPKFSVLGFEPGPRLKCDHHFGNRGRKIFVMVAIISTFHLATPADMASTGNLSVAVSTSPKHDNRDAETSTSSSPKGQCLCSPTMHQGSFRCRLHRSTSSAWMKRSKSMPANNPAASLSPKESLGSS